MRGGGCGGRSSLSCWSRKPEFWLGLGVAGQQQFAPVGPFQSHRGAKAEGPLILPRLPHITSPLPRPTAARQAACPAHQLPAEPAAVSEPSPRQSPAHLGQRPLADGSQAPPAPAPRRRTARSALPSRAGSPAHPRQSPPRCLVHGSAPQAGSCHRSAPRPRCCLGR
jgi:hypothetical protein